MARDLLMPAPDQEKSSELLQDSDIPGTYKEVEKLAVQIYGMARRNVLVAYWNLGKIADKLKENASYGSNAVEKIADKLGQQPRMLYEMIRFFQTHSVEQMPDMLLEWSSARELLRIRDPEKRLQLEEYVQKSKMTVRQVRALVNKEKQKDKKGKKTAKNRGRKPSARGFFARFDHRLDLMLVDLKKLLEKYPEMVVVLLDAEQTSEEDKTAVIGNKTHKGLAAEIADKGKRLRQQLEAYVVDMPDAFTTPTPKKK